MTILPLTHHPHLLYIRWHSLRPFCWQMLNHARGSSQISEFLPGVFLPSKWCAEGHSEAKDAENLTYRHFSKISWIWESSSDLEI